VHRIIEFDTVRVVALHGTPESHLAVTGAERPPRVGDLATVVDLITRAPGAETRYIAEVGHPDGRMVWLAEFSADEVEFVSRPPAPQ
jgi:hypothetical protein